MIEANSISTFSASARSSFANEAQSAQTSERLLYDATDKLIAKVGKDGLLTEFFYDQATYQPKRLKFANSADVELGYKEFEKNKKTFHKPITISGEFGSVALSYTEQGTLKKLQAGSIDAALMDVFAAALGANTHVELVEMLSYKGREIEEPDPCVKDKEKPEEDKTLPPDGVMEAWDRLSEIALKPNENLRELTTQEQKELLGVQYSLLTAISDTNDNKQLGGFTLSPQEWADNLTPEGARTFLERVASGRISLFTGVAGEILQFSLDNGSAIPIGRKVPTVDYNQGEGTPLSNGIEKSVPFKEGLRAKFLPQALETAKSLDNFENKIFNFSEEDFPLNYRHDRTELGTFSIGNRRELAGSLGCANLDEYSGEVEVAKVNDTLVQYEIRMTGNVKDIYDFNRPERVTLGFSIFTHAGFIVQENGLLANLNISVDTESIISGAFYLDRELPTEGFELHDCLPGDPLVDPVVA